MSELGAQKRTKAGSKKMRRFRADTKASILAIHYVLEVCFDVVCTAGISSSETCPAGKEAQLSGSLDKSELAIGKALVSFCVCS